MITTGLNDDYAILQVEDITFYYGYEYTMTNEELEEEWCFVVKDGQEQIFQMPKSILESLNERLSRKGGWNEPVEYLLTGIGAFEKTRVK